MKIYKIMLTGQETKILGIRGISLRKTISRYSATGDFEKALPSLLQARSHHACAMYQDHTGDRVSYLYEDDMLNPNQFQSQPLLIQVLTTHRY